MLNQKTEEYGRYSEAFYIAKAKVTHPDDPCESKYFTQIAHYMETEQLHYVLRSWKEECNGSTFDGPGYWMYEWIKIVENEIAERTLLHD